MQPMIKDIIDLMLKDVAELKADPDVPQEFKAGYAAAVTDIMLHHSDLLAEQEVEGGRITHDKVPEGVEVAPPPQEPA